MKYSLDHLEYLESEGIQIMREVAASFNNPVLLYSVGKDSSVLLRLAQKAFYPGKLPFQLLHINTGYKFPEMIEFRDKIIKENNLNLIEARNTSDKAKKFGPEHAHTDTYIYNMKTRPLLEAIEKNGFDAAIGGSRREEEKSRAKERIFSIRGPMGSWDPKNQRPEMWNLYNTELQDDQTIRVFPLSNWTEADIWMYIKRENIDIVPLYFSQKRKVLRRNGIFVRVDEFNVPQDGEKVIEMTCRYRTLGCSPSTGAVPSEAQAIDDIVQEVIESKRSERDTRAIDAVSDSAMEDKKKEGYF